MFRMMLCLCLAGSFALTRASAADKPNGNRLTYLDEPCNPYYVNRDFPRLTTPMWVGEEGVEAVVILGIDDMRGHEKWEAYLRPILNRLKQIDGRAPVSILTCTIDPKHPHLQQWLAEGLSLEIHTVDHPCPLLGGMKGRGIRDQGPGDSTPETKQDATGTKLDRLSFAKDTYDRCVDLLNDVPNNKPVCFRMPCCDSLNTLSPRFFTEIFAKTTVKGHFLQADSSVFHVFTSDDPVLPRALVLEEAPNDPKATNPNALAPSPLRGEGRGEGSSESTPATKINASRAKSSGVNESRATAQPPLSLTLSPAGRGDEVAAPPAARATQPAARRERFKKYIPTDRGFVNYIENYPYPYVIDRLCWEFPCVTPSDWSAQHLHKPHNPRTVEDWKAALDCTVIKQGVFCLVFHPHNWIKPEQINELIDHAVTKHGQKVKFLTFKEAVERLNKNVLGGQTLRDERGHDNGLRFPDANADGYLDVSVELLAQRSRLLRFSNRVWNVTQKVWNETPPVVTPTDAEFALERWVSLPFDPRREPFRIASCDLNRDGCADLLIQAADGSGVFQAQFPMGLKTKIEWLRLPFGIPNGVVLPKFNGGDTGLRFIDLDEDGHDDIVFSNHERYGIWLWDSIEKGWSREVLAGKRGDKPAEQELPPIVRADGSNNGFWVHSRQLVWMNEDTAKLKDLVERRTFDQLLSRRLGTPARPDDASIPDEKNAEDKTGKSAQPPEDGPKSPEESLKMMQVKSGYRVELVAAEPLVRDPVAFDWGPDGKLWVAEMADYPLGVGEGEEADGADASLMANEGSQPAGPSEITQSKPNPKPTSGLTPTVRLLERAGHKLGGGRVRFLEDTDRNGQYDKSTVFLDKLNFPNGVMAWRDGVLISAAPDVLFARDTNEDGKADEVQVLLTGFGEGNQQHRVNGFSWGLDNMVHCANGDSGGQVKVVSSVGWIDSSRPTNQKDQKTNDGKSRGSTHPTTNHIGKVIDIRGRDFRWNPDTGAVDPTTGQTQYGRNRDDFGNWFGNNNANPMYHFALDDYYIRRNPHVAPPDPRKQVSINPGPSPVFPISRTLSRFNDFAMANRFTSANSAMVYRDSLLFEGLGVGGQRLGTAEGRGLRAEGKTNAANARPLPLSSQPSAHVFISEPVHNLVHHEVMMAEGVTFTSRRPDDEQESEFLASRDNWFRPTQIKTGPDGALYIADMYRQVIEHPQYIPPAMQKKLDLRAGHDKGRIYRVVPINGLQRRVEPADEDEEPIAWPLSPAKPRHNGASDPRFDSVWQALKSPNGTIRDLAHRMIYWQCMDAGDITWLSLQEASPNASLPILSIIDGVGMGKRGEKWRELWVALQDKSPALRRRGLQALERFETEIPDQVINLLSGLGRDPDPFVRMQFAYTLGHPKFASLGHELGKLLYRERDDKYVVAAAMSSIHVTNVASVVANVFESAGKEPLPAQLASTLLGLASTLGSDQALLSLIESVLSGTATSESQPVVLTQMLESLDRRGTSLGQLEGIAPQRLARAERQLAERINAARKQVSNLKSQISDLKSEISNSPSDDAIAALPLLGREPPRRAEDAQLIGTLLIPQTPVPVQTAAVTTLARINHADSAAALLSGWRTFTPSLRTQVLDVLLSRAAWTDKLLDEIVAKTISPSDIDAARRQRLIAHSNEAIRTRAAKLLEVSANADRQKIVAEFAERLKELKTAGDATQGTEVFKKRCATCHKLKDVGTSVGSDLMSLTDKSTAALLTAILDPNKAVEAKFLAYTAVNKQGQVFSGLIAAETGNSITLTTTDGKQHTLLRADLDEFVSSNKSFMPEGLEKDVAPTELADVIAFVQSSGPPPKKFDGNQPEAVNADSSGTLKLLATNAEIYGQTLVFEPQFKNLGYWGSVDDRATWTIRVTKACNYSVRVNYACDNTTAGNEVVFEVAGKSLTAKVAGTGTWENYQTAILADLTLPAGEHRFTARAAETLKNHLMDLKEIRLVPAE